LDYIEKEYSTTVTVSIGLSCRIDEYKYGYTLSVYTYVLDESRITRDQTELRRRLSGTRNYQKDKINVAIDSL